MLIPGWQFCCFQIIWANRPSCRRVRPPCFQPVKGGQHFGIAIWRFYVCFLTKRSFSHSKACGFFVVFSQFENHFFWRSNNKKLFFGYSDIMVVIFPTQKKIRRRQEFFRDLCLSLESNFCLFS